MAVQVAVMAKKKPDDSHPAPQGQAAKIHLDVLKMARAIVGIRGGSVTELISNTCRPEFTKIIQEMQRKGEFIPKVED